MSNVDDFLSPEQLVRLTGTEKPAEQKKQLDSMGIHYFSGKGRNITTTWYQVNHPRKKAVNDGRPDFSKFQASHG